MKLINHLRLRWRHLRLRWREARVWRDLAVLRGALDAAPCVPPGAALITFMTEDCDALHGQLIMGPPNQIDWRLVLVPPEAYYCTAIAWFPGEGAAAMLGDRKGHYSHGWRDLGPDGNEFVGMWGDTSDENLWGLFGTFAGFHEAFDGPAREA